MKQNEANRLYDDCQKRPDSTNPPLLAPKSYFYDSKLLSIPSSTGPFFSPLFFKSMKGSITGEVGTIVSFWLKGDSLSRGWYHQRDLKHANNIRK